MRPALLRMLSWPSNFVTISRVLLVGGVVTALLAGIEVPNSVKLFVVVYGYWLSDHLDGWLARWTKTSSTFGEHLDVAADRFCDLALGIWVIRACPSLLWFTFVFLLIRLPSDTMLGGVAEGWNLVAEKVPRLAFLRKAITHESFATLFHLVRSAFFLFAILGSPQPALGYLVCIGCFFYVGALMLKLEVLAIEAEAKRRPTTEGVRS